MVRLPSLLPTSFRATTTPSRLFPSIATGPDDRVCVFHFRPLGMLTCLRFHDDDERSPYSPDDGMIRIRTAPAMPCNAPHRNGRQD